MTEQRHGGASLDGLGLWLAAPAPGDDTDGILERAARASEVAERAGFTSLWVSEPGGRQSEGAPYEAYSLLGALAVRTERIHLGALADGAERRPPSILAKIVTGVDVISHGRAIFTWDPGAGSVDDLDRLVESVSVGRAVLDDERPSLSGRYYSIDGAVNRPAPVQIGGVPIVVVVSGDGQRRADVLDAVAGRVDAVVVHAGADGVEEAVRAIGARGAQGAADASKRPTRVVGVLRASGSPSTHGQRAAELTAAGVAGCLIEVPYPWNPAAVEAWAERR